MLSWQPAEFGFASENVDRPQNGSAVAPSTSYWLTRCVIIRLLGAVYAVAFLAAARQLIPLIGAHGLLPVGTFLDGYRHYFGSAQGAFWRLPSIFWFNHSDAFLNAVSWIGFGLSLVVVAGFADAPLLAVLWVLYLSIVHVGQDWYGYGWETQLLETGFLGIFLCPLWNLRPLARDVPCRLIIGLFRWLICRIMLGAGLIKLRGDGAWRDLTALFYHFETQPLPNPLSRWFHFLPRGVLRGGVVFNHLAELLAPLCVFGPRPVRIAAGIVIIGFQFVLIFSGNLSFLNWLTIIPALACFDDGFWLRIAPWLRSVWERVSGAAQRHWFGRQAAYAVVALIAILSVRPAVNLLSAGQLMNTSFEPFDLVNTYGAFGSVGRVRYTLVFEGTDAFVADDSAVWKEYEYQAQPVDVRKRPPQIAPYQPRLDWAVWFAAMSDVRHYPWTLHLVWKLLHGDPGAESLFANHPFPKAPPRYVRAILYQYQFAPPGNQAGVWWTRKKLGTWLPPLSAKDPSLEQYLNSAGWNP